MTLIIACAAAVVASLTVTPVVVHAAAAWNLFDVPSDSRRVHTRPIPRLGGVAVFAAMVLGLMTAAVSGLIPTTFWVANRSFFNGLLVGGGIMLLVGMWDDVRGLKPSTKILAQCVAAAAVFFFGFRIEALSMGSSVDYELGVFAFPLTVLWVVGVTNAFNLIDGLDGLATGIALVALGTTLAVAGVLGNTAVVLVCLALIGALLGFLRYNFNPARIFLGDSGSLFVGFMLAVLSVHGSLKSATAVLVLVPLFALALPLLDTLLAIGRRWLRIMPLHGADARHIHHQLLALGLTHRRAVLVLYLASVALAIVGVALAFSPPSTVTIAAVGGGLICGTLLLCSTRSLAYHEFAEAASVLISGVMRTRRIIRDQIHARDLAQLLRRADSIRAVNEILGEGAADFHLLGMEVCRETDPGSCRAMLIHDDVRRAWKLEYPVAARSAGDPNPFVLRLWCGFGNDFRPYGAERVARILAPVVESWLAEHRQDRSAIGRELAPSFHGASTARRPSIGDPQDDRTVVPLAAAPSSSSRERSHSRVRRSS